MSKHLTDAECAAHYWEAENAHLVLPCYPSLAEARREALRWFYVWKRFATHPHAHDED